MEHGLFPAHAGVFPAALLLPGRVVTLPRARGGISVPPNEWLSANISSPRTRGYFRVGAAGAGPDALFPAHAGVFPRLVVKLVAGSTLPRARGGISLPTRQGRY